MFTLSIRPIKPAPFRDDVMVQLSLLRDRPATEDHQIMDIGRHRRSRTNAGRMVVALIHCAAKEMVEREKLARSVRRGLLERPPPEGKARRPPCPSRSVSEPRPDARVHFRVHATHRNFRIECRNERKRSSKDHLKGRRPKKRSRTHAFLVFPCGLLCGALSHSPPRRVRKTRRLPQATRGAIR